MRTRKHSRYLDESVEHEGSKAPIKQYSEDEIDDIDVDEPLEYSNQAEARRAHTRLHWAWDDRDLDGWHYDEIVAEHARVVEFLVDAGGRHVLVDSLDSTLPEPLKERSINTNYDLSYLTGIKNETIELLEQEGIDSITKLKKADPEELSENTEIHEDYLENLQEKAEQV